MSLGNEMILNLMANWQVALDGFQIFLCVLILVFLMRNRRKSKLADMKSTRNVQTREFNTEVMIQSIQQQVDQTFDTILSSINREKQNLERLFEATRAGNQSKTALLNPPGFGHPQQTREDRFRMGQHQSTADAHQMIATLADRGLGAAEIAAQLKVPLAEVELHLKLNQRSFNHSVEGTA